MGTILESNLMKNAAAVFLAAIEVALVAGLALVAVSCSKEASAEERKPVFPLSRLQFYNQSYKLTCESYKIGACEWLVEYLKEQDRHREEWRKLQDEALKNSGLRT